MVEITDELVTRVALKLYVAMQEQGSVESADTMRIMHKSLWVDDTFFFPLLAQEVLEEINKP